MGQRLDVYCARVVREYDPFSSDARLDPMDVVLYDACFVEGFRKVWWLADQCVLGFCEFWYEVGVRYCHVEIFARIE